MGVYEYRGEPGMTYLYLKTVHGTAPHTLQAGDVVDFGENEPPDDRRWVEAAEGTVATRLPDNHPDNQPVVQYPQSEDGEPEDAKPEPEPAPAETETAPAEPTKRKAAAKTTA